LTKSLETDEILHKKNLYIKLGHIKDYKTVPIFTLQYLHQNVQHCMLEENQVD